MAAKKKPAADGCVHHDVCEVGYDATGRFGDWCRCQKCGRERFHAHPSAREEHRAFGRLHRRPRARKPAA